MSRTAAAMAALLAAAFLHAPTPAAADPPPLRQQAQSIKPVPGGTPTPRSLTTTPAPAPYRPSTPHWPSAGTATASLVRLHSPKGVGRTTVDIIDHATAEAAGVPLLMRVHPDAGSTGPVEVSVDYSGFASAYGADWAQRLRLSTLPTGCATPTAAGCRPTPLATTNDGRTATATVAMGATDTVVALTASGSSGDGDYTATPLNPSSVWSAGTGSGGFSWSYAMRVPPSLGGPTPAVGLAYASQAVDGQNAASNNQPSWIGGGFSYNPGSITRSYVGCADDMGSGANNGTATGDQCWKTDNATLSLNGQSAELLYNATDGRWHMRTDNGWRIKRLTGASNGDNDGEYWVVTTTDGTQYTFGLNRLPGYTGTPPANKVTSSVYTVPVYGNNSSEPCHATAYASSSCAQAWQWNLDYVQDPNGNTESLWYTPQTNKYGANNSTTAVSYTRGGFLAHIDYGTNNRSGTDTAETATSAPMTVVFTPDNRCLSSCSTHDGVHYPDTPWDQVCSASPCNHFSPTFWIDQRLKSVTTRVWNSSAYRDVEQWTLSHTFPDPGDGTRAGLWLSTIAHSGLAGGTATVPTMTLKSVPMNNRVDTALANGLRPMNWPRLTEIDTESGAKIIVSYSAPECVAGGVMPSAPDTNTKRCFPVRWTPPDLGTEIVDYFHKYVVTKVEEYDATGTTPGAQSKITSYAYGGTPAWHYADDDGLTKAKYRTWNQWRGYSTVTTTVGTGAEQTVTKSLYFRGMNGDKLSTGTRSATVADSKGLATLTDDDQYAGMTRESTTDNGATAISGSVYDSWSSSATASRTIDGNTVYARFSAPTETHSWTAMDHSRPDRWTDSRTTFDATYGMPTSVTDNGDTAKTGDETCTLTDYARNTTAWIVDTVKETRTYAMTCTAAQTPGKVFTQADIISDDRTSYDGQTWGVAPTKGNTTRSEALKDWQNNTPTFLTIGTNGYDAYGRVADSTDVDGVHTTTAYTPASGGPVTREVTTNGATGWVTTSDLDPAWGKPTATTDPNNRRTDLTYDPFGRLTGAWLPGRSKAANPSAPNLSYAYAISATAPSVVTTKTLNPNGGYTTTYTLYDALLRARQTQSAEAGTGGGRIVKDTYYDSAGRQYLTWGPYLATGAPATTLFWPSTGSDTIDRWTKTLFDGAGRPIEVDTNSKTTQLWHSSMAYTGDRTDTTPPGGGIATSTVTDVRGRTVELRQYHGSVATGSTDPATYDASTYTYNGKNQLVQYKNPAGTVWSQTFDLRGRRISTTDPDAGTTSYTFDDAGRTLTTTDGRGVVIATAYADPLHRRTGEFLTSTSGTRLAAWAYDQVTDSRGMLTSSTRYDASGNAFTNAVTTLDSAGRPGTRVITIPATQTGLAGGYSYTTTYNADGSVHTLKLPAIGGTGGLSAETLTYGYHDLGMPTTLSTTLGSTYVVSTSFTSLGQPGTTTLSNNGGPIAQIGDYWEDATGRLSRIWTTRETAPSSVSDLTFHYDNAGNVTSTAQVSPVAGAETQCLQTNNLAQLTQAWTPTSGSCSAGPSTGAIGGSPAPYWTSWTIDNTGLRRQQIEHGTANGDRTTTYTYPSATAAGAHELTGTGTTDSSGTTNATYGYTDAAGKNTGNLASRPGPNGTQTMTWDAENRLATVTDQTGQARYLYDADGNQLITQDPGGATLYLPGQELRVSGSGGLVAATRYYSNGKQIVAQRSLSGVTWLSTDHQGTQTVAIGTAAGQPVTVRRFTPYGGARGSAPAWPNTKGFVGGTVETTGLTTLGARQYDSAVSRFGSLDPLFDESDPQSWNGFAYAGNNPVTKSDADGRQAIACADDGPCGTNTVKNPDGQPSGHSHNCDADCLHAIMNPPPPHRGCARSPGDCSDSKPKVEPPDSPKPIPTTSQHTASPYLTPQSTPVAAAPTCKANQFCMYQAGEDFTCEYGATCEQMSGNYPTVLCQGTGENSCGVAEASECTSWDIVASSIEMFLSVAAMAGGTASSTVGVGIPLVIIGGAGFVHSITSISKCIK